MVYAYHVLYHVLLLSNMQEYTMNTCNSMDKYQMHYHVKMEKLYMLYDSISMTLYVDIDNNPVVCLPGLGVRMGSYRRAAWEGLQK